MRLCPPIQGAMDPKSLTKFDRVRVRQAAFLANVVKTQSFNVGVLDFVDPKLGNKTLRHLIMGIRLVDSPSIPVLCQSNGIFSVGV